MSQTSIDARIHGKEGQKNEKCTAVHIVCRFSTKKVNTRQKCWSSARNSNAVGFSLVERKSRFIDMLHNTANLNFESLIFEKVFFSAQKEMTHIFSHQFERGKVNPNRWVSQLVEEKKNNCESESREAEKNPND